MKNLIGILALVLLLLCSCSRDIEEDATRHLKEVMRETVFHPDQAELLNTHTFYKSDSLCIIHFTLRAPNNKGVILLVPLEYVYIRDSYSQYETITAIGNGLFSKAYNMLNLQGAKDEEEKNTILTWKVEGYDYYFLITHSVEEVKDKYRSNIIKDEKYKPKEPNITDKLMFSAARLKVCARGREVSDKKGKDIKL